MERQALSLLLHPLAKVPLNVTKFHFPNEILKTHLSPQPLNTSYQITYQVTHLLGLHIE